MTNASGAVTLARSYDPYGNALTSAGSGTTNYNFAGEWRDNTSLLHLRARFYGPQWGRFLTADSWGGDYQRPLSLNKWNYSLSNPLYYTDSDGHFPWPWFIAIGGGLLIGGGIGYFAFPNLKPWNPPFYVTSRVSAPITSSNMTSWLCNQMVTNAQSDVVASIRANWTSANPVNKDAALQAWAALVGTGATWDFKVDIRRAGQFVDDTNDVVLGNRQLNYDAIANIHFGFVGRAAGFGGEFLVQAAGLAQWQRWRETGDPNDRGVCNLTYYCDHPYATWSISFGIYLFDLYKDRLDELNDDALAQALEDYIKQHGEPPAPPPGAVAP